MKRLLVPVDFTPLARHAFDHALVIAEALSGEVILLHAVHVPDAVPSGTGAEDAWMERERDRSAAELEAFLMAGNPRTTVPVSSCLVEDFPEDGIVSWAARKGADLIVMGTEGPHPLREGGSGSHALRTVNASPVPVLLLPDGLSPGLPTELVFAVDFEDHDPAVLRMLQSLAHALDARLHVLHVREHAVFDDPDEYRNYQRTFHELLDDERCSFDLVRGQDVAEALEGRLRDRDDQWLVLRTRHRGENDLLPESLTLRMAWHQAMPILAIPA
jgi:nucleotide-binding universal stress UspA family protein